MVMQKIINNKEAITNTDKVINLRNQHLDWTSADIARELHISRERVRQILSQNNLPTKRKNKYTHTCPGCMRLTDSKTIYCTRECWINKKFGVYKCAGCGIVFVRQKRIVKRDAKKYTLANKEPKLYHNKDCFLGKSKREKLTQLIFVHQVK